MKSIARLIFDDDWDPEQFKLLVVSLGGVADIDSWDAVLERENSIVWVDIRPPIDPKQRYPRLGELEKILESAPRYQVILHVSSHGESEWLAAEIALAAAEKWRLAIEGFDEKPLTIAELNKRIARRDGNLFWSKNPQQRR